MCQSFRRGRWIGLALWLGFGSILPADEPPSANACLQGCRPGACPHLRADVGTLGYGKPGLHPGFQGFGLGYHRGHGYGGKGLGVGAEGGGAFYGGPGYPHPWPKLRRLGSIEPFPFLGGPGLPSPEHPRYYGTTGPLVPDRPVVNFVRDPDSPAGSGDYGPFTGMHPYPETMFAPNVSIVVHDPRTPRSESTSSAPQPPPATTMATQFLGFVAEPMAKAGATPGLKVLAVVAAGRADQAGIRIGDVIRSIDGHPTATLADLGPILAAIVEKTTVNVVVQSAKDWSIQTLTLKPD